MWSLHKSNAYHYDPSKLLPVNLTDEFVPHFCRVKKL